MTEEGSRATVRQRVAGRLVIAGVWLLRHLPDKPAYRIAFRVGQGLSYLMPERRSLARSNLGRVCRALDASGDATAQVSAAARDGRRLDALVRAVFGYWIVTYVESAMGSRYDAAALRSRVALHDPATTAASLAPVPAGSPGPIFVGLHLGSVELGALYAALLGHVPISGPMEQVGNPVLRDYFRRTRGALGMDLLPIAGVAPVLQERIARGEAVAIVADRVISGKGARVQLFGAPARLPAGPAVLAVETGAPFYALSIVRSAPGTWVGSVERVAVPVEGTRRERLQATLDAQVRIFERFIAAAPEQWWTLLFRIWEEDAVA
jgi:phosphatidylinositol dimannoside acyltransferase